MNTICVFCNIPLSDGRPTVTLHNKGSQSVNESSIQYKDSIVTVPGQVVHTECRRNIAIQLLFQLPRLAIPRTKLTMINI